MLILFLNLKKLQEISTYEPIQTLTTADKLERFLHLKDLIISNSMSTRYQVVHAQAINHTPHHVVLYDLEIKKPKIKRCQNPRKLFAQPLRRVKGVPGEAKLRNIDPKYPELLSSRLIVECLPFTQDAEPQDVNLDSFYNAITKSIKETCKQFQPEIPPKMAWCSSRTALLCKEKNAAWSTYIKTHLQTQKLSYKKSQTCCLRRQKDISSGGESKP